MVNVMKPTLLLSAIVLYLLSSVFDAPIAVPLISILCISIIATHFGDVKRFVKILASLFVGVGVMMLMKSGSSWESYLFGFGKMLNLLSLFVLLPLVALPIELGQYAIGVQRLIQQRIRRSGSLYMMTSSLSYILSSFMNLATLPMVYYTIRPSVDLFPIKEKERFMSRAITHGFSMPVIWTPIAPIVGIVVEMTNVSWTSILPTLIVVSIFGLMLNWVLGARAATKHQREEGYPSQDQVQKSRSEVAASLDEQSKNLNSRNPIHILVAILLFNGLIMLIEKYSAYDFLLVVTMMVVPFSLLWSVFLGKGKDFWMKSKQVLPAQLQKMKDQFVLFLSAGFFLGAMQVSGAGHTFNLWMTDLIQLVGSFVFVLLIPLIPLALAFTGLHPAVGLALVAESLNPQLLGISPQIIAIAMLTGASTAFLMGPFNATIGIMSNMIGETPHRVSNWNAPFTFVYLLMIMIVLTLLQIG